ncbi:alpha/beta hydrolase family protein, partial [Rubripirellula tenax]|uniref:alpha/beta hydrolase family protein n=1 Tax=Rubripirellula tenax TaxID=2528015 RepID=UPI0016473C93
ARKTCREAGNHFARYSESESSRLKLVSSPRGNRTRSDFRTDTSYGVFSKEGLGRFVQNLGEQASEAIAPQGNIPQASAREVPQYLLRGTKDFLIRHESAEAFVQALEAKGQEVIYEQVDGAGHAFFDWKPNEQVKATFDKYGVPYAKKIRDFFEQHLYGS